MNLNGFIKLCLSLLVWQNIFEYDSMRFFQGCISVKTSFTKKNDCNDCIMYNSVFKFLIWSLFKWWLDIRKTYDKCITLVVLVTAYRVQTLSNMNVKNIEIYPPKIIIKISVRKTPKDFLNFIHRMHKNIVSNILWILCYKML